MGEWFDDTEIYRFVDDHLSLIIEIDIRDYVHARKLKRHGEDWKQMLLGRWIEDKDLVPVLKILGIPR